MEFVVRVASGARKHGVSRGRIAEALMAHVEAHTTISETTDPKIRFVGTDSRGERLEIVAIVLPGMLLVIHAMPLKFRRGQG